MLMFFLSSISYSDDDILDKLQDMGNSVACTALSAASCMQLAPLPKAAFACATGAGLLCEQALPEKTEKVGKWIGDTLFDLFEMPNETE